MRTRVIPCLTVKDGGLVKTARFRDPSYVGDPINAMRIFNEKEVDELVVLDIAATSAGRKPDLAMIREMVEEAFMPVAYGGGIATLEQAANIFEIGVEKIIINTAADVKPELVSALAERFGSQAVVVSIDAKAKMLGGWEVLTGAGRHRTGHDPVAAACRAVQAGAGEILLTAIDRDGTRQGYDLELVQAVAPSVAVPVIAQGGAGKMEDFRAAVAAGASAVAAGSLFVHHGPHRAVLISYPDRAVLEALLP